MLIDLRTGYFIITVITSVVAAANFLLYSQIKEQKFFLFWTISMVIWSVQLFGIVFLPMHLITGQLIMGVSTPLVQMFVYLSIQQGARENTAGQYAVFSVLGISLVVYIVETLATAGTSNMIRSKLGSFLYVIANAYVAYKILRFYWLRKSRLTRVERRTSIFSALCFTLYSLIWIQRLVVMMNSTGGWSLQTNNSVNVFSILLIPQITLLTNVGMTLFATLKASLRRKEIEERFILAENDAVFGRIIAGLNHELNTPLGNAKLAANVLNQSGTSPDDLKTMTSILQKSLAQLRIIAADRGKLLGSSLDVGEMISVREDFPVFSRIMERNFSANRIRYEVSSTVSRFYCSWRYFFIVLMSLGELLQTHGLDGEKELVVPLSVEKHDNGKTVFITLRHPGQSILQGGIDLVSNDGGLYPFDDQESGELNATLLWLFHFIAGSFDGKISIASIPETGNIINFSFTEYTGKWEV